MITKRKSADAMSRDFVVCDIENFSDGSVISIQTFDGERHTVHYNWCEWLEWIATMGRTHKAYRAVYAHNGGGWDWLSLIEYVIQKDRSHTFHTIQNNNRIVCVIIPYNAHVTIRLCDSWYLIAGNGSKGTLQDLGEKYLGEGKLKIDHLPEWYWKNDRETYWKYAYRDTEMLYRIMVRFMDIVYNRIARIGKVGLTIPSTSLRCYQTSYLPFEIQTPENDKVKTALRRAYVGGRVEVFRSGYYEHINVYDFNSLYPSVMQNTAVPIGGNPKYTNRLRLDKCGVYHIRFVQRNRKLLPLLMVDGLGSYEGEGWYYTNELRRFVDKAQGEIEIVSGFYFSDSAEIFKGFVDTMYALRMTDRDGPLGNTAKLMMNSLYGKFAQQTDRSRVVFCDCDEIKGYMKAGAEVELLNPELSIYRITETKPAPFEHVGIAGTITSEARARLWEAFDSGTVYCDTDSVHTTCDLPNTSAELGAMKLEFSGEAVYCGKKLYALRKPDGKETVKAKGVRVGGENGFALTFDHLRTLLDGASIKCEFKSAATSTQVFQGKSSCRFVKRTRTLRKTANV